MVYFCDVLEIGDWLIDAFPKINDAAAEKWIFCVSLDTTRVPKSHDNIKESQEFMYDDESLKSKQNISDRKICS